MERPIQEQEQAINNIMKFGNIAYKLNCQQSVDLHKPCLPHHSPLSLKKGLQTPSCEVFMRGLSSLDWKNVVMQDSGVCVRDRDPSYQTVLPHRNHETNHPQHPLNTVSFKLTL